MLLYSPRPLTSEAAVRSKAKPSGLYGRESGIGTEFSPSTAIFPCQYHHSTGVLQSYFVHLEPKLQNLSSLATVCLFMYYYNPVHKTNCIDKFLLEHTYVSVFLLTTHKRSK